MDVVTTLPRSRPLTYADLDAMPGDGHRYELVDGVLVVTPAPLARHQRVVRELLLRLHAACPPELEVMPAPFDVRLADDTVLQPDLLVARRSEITERNLPGSPLLAVEVLSPSTRHIDLSLKRARYEQAGCPSYWVVDPGTLRLRAWDLVDGTYREVADITGDEAFDAIAPYAVTLRPAELSG